jgi:chromosomal replication initiator protein
MDQTITEAATVSAQQYWDSCLKLIEAGVKPLTFKTWFKPIRAVALDDQLLTLEVPSTYFYEWIEEHHFSLVQSALFSVLGPGAKLQYAVKIPKNENSMDAETQQQAQTDRPAPVSRLRSKDAALFDKNLNPKFSFDNFVRGDGNQFACAAALNVAGNPGETAFNPLVLYGGVGLGKTHLIQAVGNAIRGKYPNRRVYYVSSEKFTVDFVEAIEKNKTIDFSNFYRSMDVLIVDDIQFLSGKERTQDTFFHTFNTLYQLKKQIILSSDRPPKDIQGLDERLISRFQCGLTVDIQPPDLETRIAILRKKAESDHIDIPQDVMDFIAANIKSNIRELEGCYIGLIARHTLEQRPIDVSLAEQVLRNIVSSHKSELSVERIQKIVAEYFKVTENSLRAKTRRQEIVLPRQVAMYLAKNFTRASLKTIGLHFAGRDHSTIIHA